MTELSLCPCIVDYLGALSGSVWLSAAIYFQLLFDRPVDERIVIGLAVVGAGLLLLSSAAVFATTTAVMVAISVISHLILALAGLIAWWIIRDRAIHDGRLEIVRA